MQLCIPSAGKLDMLSPERSVSANKERVSCRFEL